MTIWLLALLVLSASWSNNDFILNSQLELGNCTDVSNDDFNSRFILFDEFDTNLKKFFYSDYKFGSINITNVFSVAGANYTHQKIEYYNSATSVLAYIRNLIFNNPCTLDFNYKNTMTPSLLIQHKIDKTGFIDSRIAFEKQWLNFEFSILCFNFQVAV